MGNCCSRSKVKDEEEKEIPKEYVITRVKELSSTCLKYNGERCSQKWYTSSLYSDIKDNELENFNLVCCKREVKILSQLEHTNIIKFIGVYYKPKDPQPILVTEEVTSNLLYHLDKVEILEDSDKFKFSYAISEGLAYLHGQRLAHLNLYTKSILLTESLVIKIANFEYANYFSDETIASSSSSGPRGAKFNPWGFRHDDCVYKFLPANYHEYRYDSVDIYSFGCVVFNIFTLKQPTIEIKSRLEEISVPGVGNLVSICLLGQIESMQEVSAAMNICSKEHFNVPKEFAQKKLVEADIEVHDKLEKSDQSMNRETDQDTDRKSDVLKSETEVRDEVVQTECHEDAIIPQENLDVHTDRKSDVLKSETEVRDEVVQTECHEDAIIPQENLDVQTCEASKSKVHVEDKGVQTNLKASEDKVQVECTETAIVPVPLVKPEIHVQTSETKVQTEDKGVQTECKEIAVIPPRDLQDQEDKLKKENSDLISRVNKLKKENSDLISRLTALEEQSFKFTNAFTTADEGSVIKLRDSYRNMQTNGRPAANRAHKKAYEEIPSPILDHTMLAYEEAKKLAIQEFEIVSERFHSLFQLSTDGNPSQVKRDKAMMQSQQLLESFHAKSLNEKIYQNKAKRVKARIRVNELKNENNSLKTSNEKLTNENKDLRTSNAKLEIESKDLRTSNAKLEIESKVVITSNERLEIESKDLRASNEKLKNENKDLRASNENLNQQMSQLCKQLEEFKNRIAQSEEENSQLNSRIAQLEEENSQLISRLDELKKEIINKQELINKKGLIKKQEMILAELTAKVDKDILARMDTYSTRMQSDISNIVHISGIIKKRNAKQLEDEEESYKFTNAFTSAGEGSVLDISKRYRHLQHNMRASAVRASKKVYKIPAKTFFCSQTLNAYEVAKNVLLEESGKCIYMHLIKLQPSGEEFNDKMLKACMRIVDNVATDEVASDAIKRITKELKLKDAEERTETTKNDSLPPDVANYYHTLAELTWQAISRPIPMVYEKEEQVYKKDYHDLKDGESGDEGKVVVYIYPVLYSSNQWPRQIAQIGRVELEE